MEHNLDLGQHFMTDKPLLRRIAEQVPLQAVTLEIGSGTGNLSQELLKRTSSLTCVEYDPRLSAPDARVNYIQENILRYLRALEEFPFSVVVGNIPYHISEPLLFLLLDRCPEKLILVTGLSFAQKLIGETIIGRYAQNLYYVHIAQEISPSAFSPPPRVTSALLTFEKKPSPVVPELETLRLLEKKTAQQALFKVFEKRHTKNFIRDALHECSWSRTPLYQLSQEEYLQLLDLVSKLAQSTTR